MGLFDSFNNERVATAGVDRSNVDEYLTPVELSNLYSKLDKSPDKLTKEELLSLDSLSSPDISMFQSGFTQLGKNLTAVAKNAEHLVGNVLNPEEMSKEFGKVYDKLRDSKNVPDVFDRVDKFAADVISVPFVDPDPKKKTYLEGMAERYSNLRKDLDTYEAGKAQYQSIKNTIGKVGANIATEYVLTGGKSFETTNRFIKEAKAAEAAGVKVSAVDKAGAVARDIAENATKQGAYTVGVNEVADGDLSPEEAWTLGAAGGVAGTALTPLNNAMSKSYADIKSAATGNTKGKPGGTSGAAEANTDPKPKDPTPDTNLAIELKDAYKAEKDVPKEKPKAKSVSEARQTVTREDDSWSDSFKKKWNKFTAKMSFKERAKAKKDAGIKLSRSEKLLLAGAGVVGADDLMAGDGSSGGDGGMASAMAGAYILAKKGKGKNANANAAKELIALEKEYKSNPKKFEGSVHLDSNGNVIDISRKKGDDFFKGQMMVDVKANPGKELAKTKPFEGPKVNRKIKMKEDAVGRQYTSNWLNSWQGKDFDKAANVVVTVESKDHKKFVEDNLKSFKSEMNTKQRYGNTETKLKGTKPATQLENNLVEKTFTRDLYMNMYNNKKLSFKDRMMYKKKAEAINTENSVPVDLEKATAEKFADQKIIGDTVDYNTEMKKQWDYLHRVVNKKTGEKGHGNADNVGAFIWEKNFQEKLDKGSKLTARNQVYKAIEKKMDKNAAMDALYTLELNHKLAGNKGQFNINDTNHELKSKFPDEYKTVEHYMQRKADLAMAKAGPSKGGLTSMKELSWRESKRLDAEGNDLNGLKSDELAAKMAERQQDYADIGIYKDLSLSPKQYKDKPKDAVDKPVDMKVYQAKYDWKNKALNDYREKGYVSDNMRRSGRAFEKGGEPILSKSEMRDIDMFGDRITNDEIIKKTLVPVPGYKRADVIKENQQQVKANIKDRTMAKQGITSTALPGKIIPRDTVKDISNSMMSNAALVTGSETMAKKVFISDKNPDDEIRAQIGKEMSKTIGHEVAKDDVKTPFMIKSYGSGDKGLIRSVLAENKFLKTEEDATKFIVEFNNQFAKQAPELNDLMKQLEKVHEDHLTGEYAWWMPDDRLVEFNTKAEVDYVIGKTKKGYNDNVVTVTSEAKDANSKALVPRLFHSIDAYVLREINRTMGWDIATIHDAYKFHPARVDEFENALRDVYSKLTRDNILDDILKQIDPSLEYKMKPLDRSYFDKSKKLTGFEQRAGVPKVSENSSENIGKQMTAKEVVMDNLAKASHRSHDYNKMVDAMIDEVVITKENIKRRSKDDIFEITLYHALNTSDFKHKVGLPKHWAKKMSEKNWKKFNEQLFYEFRAKLEYNPDIKVKGKRLFFDENGDIINGTIKSKRAIREEQLNYLKSSGQVTTDAGVKKALVETKKKAKDVKSNSREETLQRQPMMLLEMIS